MINTGLDMSNSGKINCISTKRHWCFDLANTLVCFRRETHWKTIPHTGDTRPSCMCLIQEYRYYTMSVSQYHGCCQYHESMSIPLVHVYTMSPCLYHESMSMPLVHVYTMNPCLYHAAMSIPY